MTQHRINPDDGGGCHDTVLAITAETEHRSDMPALLGPEHYGAGYFQGRSQSNYVDYERRQGRKIVWLPLLWTFSRIATQYGRVPLTHLDVGCALGYFCSYARPFVHRSAGVDISSYAIARAREQFPDIDFRRARAEQLPFAAGTFDIVTSFDTLEHLPDVSGAVAELHRVLRPKGTLLARMPYAGFVRRCFGWRDRDPTHISVLPLDAWKSVITRAGFTLVRSLRYPTLIGGQVIILARRT